MYNGNIWIFEEKYYDPAGYGSLNKSLADAKEIDPTIQLNDVQQLLLLNL